VVIGWRGGVGRAVLGLLSQHPRGRALADTRTFVLVDDDARAPAPRTAEALRIERTVTQHVGDEAALRRLLVDLQADELIDLAGLDWRASLRVCTELGVDSLGTSLERWDAPSDRDLLADAAELAPGLRPDALRGHHVLAAGMNPGCVNALVDTAARELAVRTGRDVASLGIAAIYVTEHDTTDCDDDADGLATSWSPACCRMELLTPRAAWVDRGRVRATDHAPWQAQYRVRCGDAIIDGHLVPHDEVVTLSWRWPDVELAYLVRLPERTRAWLDAQPRPTGPDLRMWPPHATAVRGRDVVGVLVCTREQGELWCGFDTDAVAAARFDTNATLLQVAAGVVAGWHRLGDGTGVHFIEELDTAAVVADASAIIGPPKIVHDSAAPFRPLPSRRCP
jgi:homospermidine synthase